MLGRGDSAVAGAWVRRKRRPFFGRGDSEAHYQDDRS